MDGGIIDGGGAGADASRCSVSTCGDSVVRGASSGMRVSTVGRMRGADLRATEAVDVAEDVLAPSSSPSTSCGLPERRGSGSAWRPGLRHQANAVTTRIAAAIMTTACRPSRCHSGRFSSQCSRSTGLRLGSVGGVGGWTSDVRGSGVGASGVAGVDAGGADGMARGGELATARVGSAAIWAEGRAATKLGIWAMTATLRPDPGCTGVGAEMAGDAGATRRRVPPEVAAEGAKRVGAEALSRRGAGDLGFMRESVPADVIQARLDPGQPLRPLTPVIGSGYAILEF